MKKTVLLAVLLLIVMIGVLAPITAVSAFVAGDTYTFTCSTFSTDITTNAPFIVVEIYNVDTNTDEFWEAMPATGSSMTVTVNGTFDPDALYELWVWGSPTNDRDDWDGEDYLYTESTCDPVPEEAPGPGIPAGFELHTITCDVAVYNMPGGTPVTGSTIRSGQTWFVNPTPVVEGDTSWTEIFAGGFTNGYIPTECVG
jgi:hypothetical protein